MHEKVAHLYSGAGARYFTGITNKSQSTWYKCRDTFSLSNLKHLLRLKLSTRDRLLTQASDPGTVLITLLPLLHSPYQTRSMMDSIYPHYPGQDYIITPNNSSQGTTLNSDVKREFSGGS